MKAFLLGLTIMSVLASARVHADEASQTIASLNTDQDSQSYAPEIRDPFYLTTYSEISDLPANDQIRYLDEVRAVASDFPTNILAAQGSGDCKEDQKQCEAPLFGSNSCVPAKEFSFQECSHRFTEKKMSLFFREPTSEGSWDDFSKKVGAYCDDASHAEKCHKLEELRVELFMSRKSH